MVEARELLAQGIDPKVQRNAQDEAKRAETEHTFENVATAWFELKKDSDGFNRCIQRLSTIFQDSLERPLILSHSSILLIRIAGS